MASAVLFRVLTYLKGKVIFSPWREKQVIQGSWDLPIDSQARTFLPALK